MNLPTKITVSRLFLTLVIIVILFLPETLFGAGFSFLGIKMNIQYIVCGVLFIIASLTDFLDGYLARKNNQVTDLGKMLDAIADKVLVNPILIVLAYNGYVPVLVPVIYITRDIVVDAIKMQAASKGKVQGAIKSGKYKTAAMMVGLCLVFFYNLPFELINIRVDWGLLYLACILSVVSAFEYFMINKELISSK